MIYAGSAYGQQFGFVTKGGGNASSAGINHISADPSSNSFYATGIFTGNAVFGSESVSSPGGSDAFLIKYSNDGTEKWAVGSRSSGSVYANRVAADKEGNVYIAGHYQSNVQFGGVTTLTFIANVDVFLAKYDSSGSFQWAVPLSGSGEHECWGLAVDSQGDVYISGLFIGDVDFDGSTISSTGGGLDMYLAKFDRDGNPQWFQRTTSAGQENATNIAITPNDKVILTGFISADTDFGGNNVSHTGGLDIFIAEYDTDGNCVWAIADGSGPDEVIDVITTDTQGNIYLAGRHDGNPSTISGTNFNTNGSQDMLLLKYNRNGIFQWGKSLGSVSSDQLNAIACDSNDNVYVGGQYTGAMTISGTPYSNAGGNDALVAKLASDGTLQWVETFGGIGGENVAGLIGDIYGTLTLGGHFTGTVNFAGNNRNAGAGNRNTYVANIFISSNPDISTTDIVSDSPFTATATSVLSTEGNSAVTAKGFVWDTDPSPTVALSTKSVDGNGAGIFSALISGLTFNTRYYIRSYATNAQGTFYGPETSFRTGNYPISLDGNRDYILDSTQINVETLWSDITDSYVTIESTNGKALSNISISDFTEETGWEYPFGRISFDVTGSQADIKLYFHGSENSDYIYRKSDGRGAIYELEDTEFRLESVGDGSALTVSFSLYDGGEGDSDNTVNGVIKDPGGPATPILNASIPVWDWWYVLVLLGGAWIVYRKFMIMGNKHS